VDLSLPAIDSMSFSYKGRSYTVTEASVEAASNYKKGMFAVLRDAKMASNGEPSMDGINIRDVGMAMVDVDIKLATECITYQDEADCTVEAVDDTFVKKLPNRLVTQIVAWIKQHSGLDLTEEQKKVAAKN
jgi:hypothetical protein